MKKLLLAFLISLCFNINAQTVDIPFIFFDGIYTVTDLRVGLDSIATYGIDTLLGEFPVPTHFPPTGTLQLWFNLDSLELATFRDYRFAPSFPYSGILVHRFSGYLSTNATALTIIYNFPQGVTANVKDSYGGTLFNQDLSGSGSYTFPTYVAGAILTMYYYSVVPIELTSFTASVLQNEKVVQLNWTTATETNNSGFAVERMPIENSKSEIQNSNWTEIGFVPGFGTTTEPKSYTFTDEDVTTGVYEYRLKQIDFDGSFTHSNEIEVEVDFTPKEFVLYQNYPNPFNPSTKIKYEIPNVETHRDASLQMITLKVYDVLGNEVATLVNEEKQPGVYEVEFNTQISHSGEVRNLTSGIYFYKLIAGEFTQTRKMIILR